MGSSYRQDLNNGRCKAWEMKLREAIGNIQDVSDELWSVIGDDSQFDNAADDGALLHKLSDIKEMLLSELPLTPKEKEDKIKVLQRQLDDLMRKTKSLNSITQADLLIL